MNSFKQIMKVAVVLTTALLLMTVSVFAADSKFKKMNKDGSANIIFASTNIKKGEEGKAALKTRFDDSESIYARAYFPAKFGQLKGEEEGFIDVWIDGKHEKRLNFSNKDVAADKDQMLIYVYNTNDYAPDFKSEVWEGLSAGEHRIKLVVGKTQFMRKGASIQDQGDRYVVKRDDVHKAVYLSDSDFTFVKN